MNEVQTKGEFIPKLVAPAYQAVLALTLPPRGQKLVGTCVRVDINGQVIVLESDMKRVDTLWRTDIGHLYAVPNVLLQSDSLEVLRKDIHERIDKVFKGWLIAFPEVPVNTEVIVPPSEQQPTSEALNDLAKQENPELHIVDISVESNLSPSQAEVSHGNK